MPRSVKCKCLICGEDFFRCPSQVARGANKTCSIVCRNALHKRSNPFAGRKHTEATKRAISASRKGKCVGNTNGTGYRHTEDAKRRISLASKRLWREHTEKMLQSLPRGKDHWMHMPPEKRRYRENFSIYKRRNWRATNCFYCGTSAKLELDHIVPVFDGGKTERANAQTLCRRCNIWKHYFCDLPRHFASLGRQGVE